MAPPSIAALEIDQTLRLARDDAEAQIARYRLWAFAGAAAITLVGSLVLASRGQVVTLAPTYSFVVAIGYAFLVRRFVARYGARPWLARACLTVDLFFGVAPFLVVFAFSPPEARTTTPTFAVHLTGAAMAIILSINALRGDVFTSLIGALLGSFFALFTLVFLEGFQPPQVDVVLLLWIAGGVGVAAARQARRTLDRFARLQLLRRYLSPAAVERVLREDPDAALSLGGQLLTVTILSADLRGFTAMSEALAPGEVVRQLNEFHGAMLEQIEAHGGVLDKFIGDGILVVFGLERAAREASLSRDEGDAGARRAVDCAHAMFRALDALNGMRGPRGESPLRMGIGVHTGAVVAGNIGAPGRRLEFTVIGDAVNTAARLEGLTKEAGTPLLVSADTASRLGDGQNELRERAPMTVRGKTAAMRVFGLPETPPT